MSTSHVKKSFLRQVKVNDVIEKLKADNYFLKSHHEMMACVKDTFAYKQMHEVAVKHLLNTLTNTSRLPDAETCKEKKNQIARIGRLAMEINSSISKTISDRLRQEATVIAKRALKRLSEIRLVSSDSLSNKGTKRKQSASFNEKNKRTKEDSESDVSLDGISESVSSVHTSDLSSFDDEIVVSSEDEKGVKKEKRIPFKTANKAYFDDEFPKMCSIVHQENDAGEASKQLKTEKNSLSNASMKFMDAKDNISRPKRERKPNSKYSE